jgi:GIY-YIG catalytic domain
VARIRSVKPTLFGSQLLDPGDAIGVSGVRSVFGPDLETLLYRFHDAAGHLLYVGITRRPAERWTRHRQSSWWSQIARLTTETFPSERAALAAEREVIRTEGPIYNRRSAVGV